MNRNKMTLLDKAKAAKRKVGDKEGDLPDLDESIELTISLINREVTHLQVSEAIGKTGGYGSTNQSYAFCVKTLRRAVIEGKIEIKRINQ